MRRYFPRIHLIESVDGTNFDYQMRKEFCFPETEFIAVSSYRNKQVDLIFFVYLIQSERSRMVKLIEYGYFV